VLVNLILSVVSQLVSVGGQLLTVPFFLRAWGDGVYGDWLTLSALSSYLSLTDMGMQLYVINRLTGHEVRRERSEFVETLQSALLLYGILSSVAITLLLGLTFGLPWARWFNGRAMTGTAVPHTVVLLGTSALLLVWCGFFGGIHRIYGQAQKTTAIGVGFRSMLLAATLGVLWIHRGPAFLAAIQMLLPVIVLVWTIVNLKQEHAELSFGLAHANVRSAVAMLAPSALFAVFTLATGLSVQGTLLVTSSLLGPAAVAGFSTSRTLANVVRLVVSLLNNVAWPEFTRLEASGRSRALSSAYRLLVKVGSLLATWMVASLWFTGPTLYLLWTRGRARFDPWLFRLLLVDVLLQTPSWASGALLGSTNRHRALAMLYVVQGVLAVALCPLAIKFLGVIGVGIVLAATNFPLFGFVVPAWAERVLGESPRPFFLEIYAKFLPVLAATGAAAWVAHRLAPAGWFGIFMAVGVTSVPIALGGVWWIRPAERNLAISAFRKSARS
jgi:O-antigen/teichoic acid export membrane protein